MTTSPAGVAPLMVVVALVGLLPPVAHAAVGLVPVTTAAGATYVTPAGDGSHRLFVVERAGRILVLQPGSATPTVFLDITATVRDAGGEEGLLSLAFHPGYAINGRLYVYYTDNGGNNVVARYSRSTDPDVADAGSGQIVLTIPHPTFENHNGGQLQFGPDGFLYVSVGDGGGGGDPNGNGQALTTLLGKLLRIDVDGGLPYAIPADNPFVGAGGGVRGEIWALGLRNPWRFSFDRAGGALVLGDVGQMTREEVNVQPASSAGGENYCWRRLEGTSLFDVGTACAAGMPTDPVLEYGHDHGRCSITGGYVYRGSAGTLPDGTYLFADFCSGEIFFLQNGFTGVLLDTPLLVSSFGEDGAGEPYVADFGGTIQRLVDSGTLAVTLGVNRLLAYRTGDTLRLGLGARNPEPPFPGDVYLGVLLPDGVTAVFVTALAPVAAVVTSAAASPGSFPPLASGVTVAGGLELAMADILGYTFTGAETAGEYTFFLAVTAPGALVDGSIDPGDVLGLALQRITFVP